MKYQGNNSKAFPLELLNYLTEIFHWYYMYGNVRKELFITIIKCHQLCNNQHTIVWLIT